ncbi:hypothetical protein C3L33_21946, partial [Rhododendron williamsianum]
MKQLVKFAQVNSLTEKQVQQLNAKPEEISQLSGGKAEASEELRKRDDMIIKIEEENVDVHGKLKCSSEQLRCLEAAHKRLRFENVTVECHEAKSNMVDQDVAEQRKALGTNEIRTKEIQYRITHHEQENQELVGSLKEFRKAEIQNAGGNSLKMLQNRELELRKEDLEALLLVEERA